MESGTNGGLQNVGGVSVGTIHHSLDVLEHLLLPSHTKHDISLSRIPSGVKGLTAWASIPPSMISMVSGMKGTDPEA